MPLAIWFFIIVTVISLSLSGAYALEISEVEPNPAGDDKGNEWVELYSHDEVNLEGYFFMNSKGKHYNLTGSFSGYTVIVINSSFITNTNETITLGKEGETIDATDVLEDERNDDRTWNQCDGEWIFMDSSRGEENQCESDNEDDTDSEQNQTDQGTNETEQEDSDPSEEDAPEAILPLSHEPSSTPPMSSAALSSPKNKEKVVLNSPSEDASIKTSPIISNEGWVQRSVIYIFAGFCVVLIILLSLRKL